jgi:protein TonB
MARKEPSAEPGQRLTGENGEDLGSMTLGELKNFLADIEHRVSRLGPHLQQLATGVAPSRIERADSLADTVIPFPSRRAADPAEGADVLSHSRDFNHDFNLDAFARRRTSAAPALAMHAAAEETVHASRAEAPDDRPRGIDALLAAAPAWANASPTARAFNEDAFLARHAYLAPSRRPGENAPASLFYSVTPAAPLAPPSAVLPAVPTIAAIVTMPHPPALELVREAPSLIGLDAEEDPLLSPLERLQNAVMRLPPREVFIALAGLTIFAGGLAGFMAFHTLHPSRAVQFKDLQQVHFGVDSTLAATSPDGAPAASAPTASTAPLSAMAAPPVPARAVPVQQPSAVVRPKPHVFQHTPAVSVWPPVPRDLVRADAAQPAPATAQPSKSASAPHPASSVPLSVSTSTMIGYALSAPQPSYPSAQAHGISGSVVVEVIVSRLGDVTSVRAISGPAELRPAAMAAVHEWRFRPYLVSGKAAEVTTTLPFYFKGQ